MKNKLKEGWIPKHQQTWNDLPLAKGQPSDEKIRRHPEPSKPPQLSNHDRALFQRDSREKKNARP